MLGGGSAGREGEENVVVVVVVVVAGVAAGVESSCDDGLGDAAEVVVEVGEEDDNPNEGLWCLANDSAASAFLHSDC